jgi:hypothetical protein
MNWGLRILILYGAFMALILFMVFRTMNESVDLVSENYYQDELKFQGQIDRENQSAALSQSPLANVSEKEVEVKFPGSISKEKISGTIKFYRPSDSSRDFSTALQLDSAGTQHISAEKLEKGIYQIQLTWTSAGKNFYNEIPIYIP